MLSAGDEDIRVTFKDYKFFIPTDAAGAKVQLIGTYRVKDITESQAKHYAQDAGENPDDVQGTKKEYNLVANSVKVMK